MGAPVAVDHDRQERPENQKEIRHPEMAANATKDDETVLARSKIATPSTE